MQAEVEAQRRGARNQIIEQMRTYKRNDCINSPLFHQNTVEFCVLDNLKFKVERGKKSDAEEQLSNDIHNLVLN